MIAQNTKYPELVCIRAVEPRQGFVVHVTFTDGTERDIDLDPYIGNGPVFAAIRRDPEFFRQVYVDPETRTLTWPNGADIAPETLYYEGNPPWAMSETSPKRPGRLRSTAAHSRAEKRRTRARATAR